MTKSWDGNGYARQPPPLDAEHLDLLRETLGVMLLFETAPVPDEEDGFSDMVECITDQLYFEGWHHYGYDQSEGLDLLLRPDRIAGIDARTWVRLLNCVHRADYWTDGSSTTFWSDVTGDGRLRLMHDRLDRLIASAA